jgi:hypothetical protein
MFDCRIPNKHTKMHGWVNPVTSGIGSGTSALQTAISESPRNRARHACKLHVHKRGIRERSIGLLDPRNHSVFNIFDAAQWNAANAMEPQRLVEGQRRIIRPYPNTDGTQPQLFLGPGQECKSPSGKFMKDYIAFAASAGSTQGG